MERSSGLLTKGRAQIGMLCALALASTSACSGGSDEARSGSGDGFDYELFESTVVLDEEALEDLASQDDDGTLHFDGTPDALAEIEPYQVILGGPSEVAPRGLLRIVTAVESDDDGLVLSTMQAPLELAFRKLHVEVTRSVDAFAPSEVDWKPDAIRTLSLRHGETTQEIVTPPIDGDGDPETPDDQVAGSGALSGNIDYVIGIDVDWGEVFELPDKLIDCIDNLVSGDSCSPTDLLPELTVGYHVRAEAAADLELQGVAFLPYDPKFEFDPIPLEPFDVNGILWFFPTLELRGQLMGEASSQFHLATTADAGFEAGVSFSSKDGASDPKPDLWYDFSAPAADATLFAKSRIEVTPEVHLWLYGTMGPYAGLTPWVELSANQEDDPCWRLDAGVDGKMGIQIQVDIPGIKHLVSFPGWDFSFPIVPASEVDTGSCPPLEGGELPTSPAAGSPTEDAFVNPSFEPWSMSYAGAVVNHTHEWPGAQIEWTSLTPTIDGRFLITGSNSNTLLKIDPAGDVIWGKRYEPPEPFNEAVEITDLLPSFVVNTSDAASLLVAHPWTVLKIDPSGALLWTAHFAEPHSEEVYRITNAIAAPDNGIYLIGNTGDDVNLKTRSDTLLARLDARGMVLWARRFGEETLGERGQLLVGFEDGIVAAGSTRNDAESTWRAYVVHLDGSGEVVWSKEVVAPECTSPQYEGSTFFTTGLVTAEGDLVLGGTLGRAPDATLVVKIKPDGELAWFATDTAPSPHLGPMVNALVELPTSGYLAAGTFNYWEPGSIQHDEVWLGALDGVGRLQWMRRYGAEQTIEDVVYRDEAYPALSLTQDGGALLAAFADSFDPDRRGLWALKVPAKDGLIELDAATSTHTGDLPWAPNTRHCVTLEDYPVSLEDHLLVPESLDVTVYDVTVSATARAP